MPAWGAIASVAVPLIGGILGYQGQKKTNEENKNLTREQMDFQERMSNTAAQRGVEDYRKAGLNPALAYDRGASSPGGASAVMGNAAQAGMSNATAVAAMRQQLQIAKEQHASNMANDNVTRANVVTQSLKTTAEIEAIRQAARFAHINQPFDNRRVAAEALLAELLLPGAKNTADWETILGKGRPGIASAKTLSEIIKMLNPRDFRR